MSIIGLGAIQAEATKPIAAASIPVHAVQCVRVMGLFARCLGLFYRPLQCSRAFQTHSLSEVFLQGGPIEPAIRPGRPGGSLA